MVRKRGAEAIGTCHNMDQTVNIIMSEDIIGQAKRVKGKQGAVDEEAEAVQIGPISRVLSRCH